MINHISIRNFAIIAETEIDFCDGLNIITGETGAGKSIVIEAISLALGSRADSSYVRTGADKAVIQLAGTLNGEDVVISREIAASGKNLCRLNGNLVTLAQLNQTCRRLADIHGQYDNQSLLNPENHIHLLDAYRRQEIQPLQETVQTTFAAYSDVRHRLSQLLAAEKESRRHVDFLRYEADEIEKAAIRPGEDAVLEDRLSLLQNSEKIFSHLEQANALLSGEASSALDGLRQALHLVEGIAPYAEEINTLAQQFGELYYNLDDLSRSLRAVEERLTFDPAELNEAISRMDLLDNLKKKYGETLEDVLNHYETISTQLSAIENFGRDKAALEKELRQTHANLLHACAALTEVRQAAAVALAQDIQRELRELNFIDSRLKIQISPLEKPTENGVDQVEILISTNPGEPLKPLAKIASGGEMSRIMLACKNITSAYDQIPTLIFDEIDAGISGITASIVGRKLREISRQRQIICITHLPQIAACGDANYRIYKETEDGSTFTRVEALQGEETALEIARLLGGDRITETTLRSAKELIASQS